jgi:hypothetical protein
VDIREEIELRQFKRLEAELRHTWMSRALRATQHEHRGMVMLSVIAHNFDGALLTLMEVTFPGFKSIVPPFLCTAAKVAKDGSIVADIRWYGHTEKDVVLYPNEIALRDDFRRLADRQRLTDDERIEMFKCVQRWVVADRRLDPTMDPRDPDAKRLVH